MKNNSIDSRLLAIAKEHSCEICQRGDLEYRNSDNEDYIEVSVGSLTAILEDAFHLGYSDGKRSAAAAGPFFRPDVKVLPDYEPVDRNDPESEKTAVRLSLPTNFSTKAQALWLYLDDTAFLYAYKGRLVLTDESCELTEAGDGSHDAPWGSPRAICDSWDELERWMETAYDDLKEDGLL